jgi:hypothetical protein
MAICTKRWCGREAVEPFKTCEFCRLRHRQYRLNNIEVVKQVEKETRESFKAVGICPKCKIRDSYKDYYSCRECLLAHRETRKAQRARLKPEVEAGKRCSSCLQDKSTPGGLCHRCRDYNSEWYRHMRRVAGVPARIRRQAAPGAKNAPDRIAEALEHGPLTLEDLAEAAGVSTRTVLRQARVLEAGGIIKVEAVETEHESFHKKQYRLVKFER